MFDCIFVSQVLWESACHWRKQLAVFEQDHLGKTLLKPLATKETNTAGTKCVTDSTLAAGSDSTDGHWCSVVGGPYLVLVSVCLLVPNAPAVTAATTEPKLQHLAGTAVAALLLYLPHCKLW